MVSPGLSDKARLLPNARRILAPRCKPVDDATRTVRVESPPAGCVVCRPRQRIGAVMERVVLCLLTVLLAMMAAAPASAGSVTGSVVLEPAVQPPLPAHYRVRTRAPILAPDPPRAIVYLERADGVYPPPGESSVVVVDQQGYQFRPALAAVRSGSRVTFPNRDDEFHSVFSYSEAKRFDLGRFRKDEPSPHVTFDQPGLVRIYCEIHKHMHSLLLVLETPWFTATDTEGNFELRDVPPGDYTLRAFLPSERELERQVSITAGAAKHVDLGP
jgi:plastocyanin